MRLLLLLFSVLPLVGCAASWPLAVLSTGGGVMHGEARQGLVTGNTFSFSDGRATCSGTFEPARAGETISIAFRCTDGRSGIGQGVRDGGQSGSGTMQFSDGSTARFVWGATASGI